jgi:hypothetical protein
VARAHAVAAVIKNAADKQRLGLHSFGVTIGYLSRLSQAGQPELTHGGAAEAQDPDEGTDVKDWRDDRRHILYAWIARATRDLAVLGVIAKRGHEYALR